MSGGLSSIPGTYMEMEGESQVLKMSSGIHACMWHMHIHKHTHS